MTTLERLLEQQKQLASKLDEIAYEVKSIEERMLARMSSNKDLSIDYRQISDKYGLFCDIGLMCLMCPRKRERS